MIFDGCHVSSSTIQIAAGLQFLYMVLEYYLGKKTNAGSLLGLIIVVFVVAFLFVYFKFFERNINGPN